MKQVTKKEFYDSFKHLDAVCNVTQTKPHVETEWNLRNHREVIAKSVDDEHGIETSYFIK